MKNYYISVSVDEDILRDFSEEIDESDIKPDIMKEAGWMNESGIFANEVIEENVFHYMTYFSRRLGQLETDNSNEDIKNVLKDYDTKDIYNLVSRWAEEYIEGNAEDIQTFFNEKIYEFTNEKISEEEEER